MKIIYYFNKSRQEREKTVVNSIYGEEIVFVQEKPWMIASTFTPGDFFIANSVEDLIEGGLSTDSIDDAIREYMNIFNRGVELLFDKSTQCNSLFIKTLASGQDEFEQILRKCIMNYLAQRNIESKYAKKHAITAEANGNRIGIKKGTKLTTRKSVEMKKKIRELSRDFNGELTDEKLLKELKIARNSFYKYKRELRAEEVNKNDNIRPE